MRSIIILAILVVTGILKPMAAELQSIDSANNYYTQGKYEQAIVSYEIALKSGYEAAELYYNLGNAYYKTNQFPMAILNYERAKRLNPTDPDIEFNLNLSNTHVIDKIDVMPELFLKTWKNNLLNLMSSNQWTLFSMVSFLLALALALLFFLSDKTVLRKLAFWFGVFLFFFSVFTFNYARKTKRLAVKEPYAIIVTPSVVVRSAPAESGTELFLIHEGLKVKVVDHLGEWKSVMLTNGSKGWVKQTDLIEI